ncbi:MAG: hypothetical protein JRN07_04830 [Nitrososphaerota archaeon]|nr:hypothetical protein [Nitrososphaerota archaeon]
MRRSGHFLGVRRLLVPLALLLLVGTAAACGTPAARHRGELRAKSGASQAAAPRAAPTVARFSHVFLVVMENEPYGAALSDPSIRALAHRYGYDSRSYAASHPSLPNYLALTGGSTFGISSDCLTCYVSASNLATELQAAHVSWAGYFQSVTSPCYLGTSYGVYAAKHNPFRYYRQVRSSPSLCNRLRPYGELAHVLAGKASTVPRFVWVTPNVCSDGHSCPLSTGDHWLSTFVPRVINSSAFSSTAMFIVYDEGSPTDLTGGGGYVACLLVSPFAKPGYVSHVSYSHYSLLATVETIFGLGNMGRNDATASPMSDLFAGGLP